MAPGIERLNYREIAEYFRIRNTITLTLLKKEVLEKEWVLESNLKLLRYDGFIFVFGGGAGGTYIAPKT